VHRSQRTVSGCALTPRARRRRQARQASRIALITLALYLVTMLAQVITAWSSKRANERRWHMTVPLVLGGVALMCARLACCAPWVTRPNVNKQPGRSPWKPSSGAGHADPLNATCVLPMVHAVG